MSTKWSISETSGERSLIVERIELSFREGTGSTFKKREAIEFWSVIVDNTFYHRRIMIENSHTTKFRMFNFFSLRQFIFPCRFTKAIREVVKRFVLKRIKIRNVHKINDKLTTGSAKSRTTK